MISDVNQNDARHAHNGGASSEKCERSGGGGNLTYFFNLKVYRTNLMQFFFDNFCRLLGLCEEKSPQSPRGAATAYSWSWYFYDRAKHRAMWLKTCHTIYAAAKFRNNIPFNIKQSPTLISFRKRLELHLVLHK